MFTRCIKTAACALAIILGLFYAMGAQANSCAPATTRGTAPSDYQDYCWLDFSGYSDSLAQAGGQPFTFTLADGSILTLTLHVSTNKTSPALGAHIVPSWTGSAIGHSGFSGIPGNPVLYEIVSGSTVQVVLSNISVVPPAGGGSTSSYAIIAADGESSNQNEKLIFTTNGQPWTQIAQIPYGTVFPSVSGLGSATVTETGVAGTVGSFAFGSFNNPTQVTATLVGGGLQGAMFAIRYASLSVTTQFSGARASPSDQFVYSISTAGGHVIATETTSGSGGGPFTPAVVPAVAAGYPFVVSEAMAPGSVSTLASYVLSLTCTNAATGGSSTVMPVNQIGHTYTFPALHYGDAVSCTFTNTANRSNLAVLKSGPASQSAGGPVSYTVVLSNSGPIDASGALIKDPATANFTANSVTCSAVTGGAVCPSAGLTLANLQGPGVTVPVLPSGGSVTLVVTGTAGNGGIVNVASVVAPSTVVNSNPTPSSSVSTSITPAPDAESTAVFPASANAGQPVAGTVLFSNIGAGIANSTSFAISVPANLSAAPTLSGLPPGATYTYVPASGVVTLAGMPTFLAAGGSVGPIRVSYLQPGSGSSTVTANVTTIADINLSNNKVAVIIGGVAIADLTVTSHFPPNTNAGQTVSGTLTFANGGPSTAAGVQFGITLPAHLAVAPVLTGLPPGAVALYNAATGLVTLTGMPTSIASGTTLAAIGISYVQPNTGTSTVSASFMSATTESPLARQSATSTITGQAAQLAGVVFLDNNQNGLFDAGDTSIAGALVELSSGTRVIATTSTNALGAYVFTGETPGLYTVSVAPLQGNVGDTPAPVKVSLGGASAPTVNFGQIPKGPVGALVLTKSTPLVNVTAGQSVPYTITATNSQSTALPIISLTDLMPAGFRFRTGSGTINGQRQDPAANGRTLTWLHLHFAAGEKKTFTLVLTTGAGVVGGDYVNQSTAYNGATNALVSNLATATVRVVGDPTFDCPDLIGRVFDDVNANGIDDPGELGIAGVRLVTAQGLLVTTDAQGRYHIACPVMPGDLGSNFILKLDERTLPSGYRLTTDNPETIRLTAGKVSKLNFGATIHHVVRIELNDAAFDGNELRLEVFQRVDALVSSMKDQAFVVRLAYAAADESDALISLRMQALRAAMGAVWKTREVSFPLRIEEDIVRGAKPGPIVPGVVVPGVDAPAGVVPGGADGGAPP
jgi:uncharacterized repeat protein (TIGR01451 family)